MADIGRELDDLALDLEFRALTVPRFLAASVLGVALGRVVGGSGPTDRTRTQQAAEKALRETLAEYDALLPPYVVPAQVVDPKDRAFDRQHPYDPLRAWQEQAPGGEWRIYPSWQAAAADGMPVAKKVAKLREGGHGA